jgi:hypothetical protein
LRTDSGVSSARPSSAARPAMRSTSRLGVDVELHGDVDRLLQRAQQLLERARLRQVAGIAVEHEAGAGDRPCPGALPSMPSTISSETRLPASITALALRPSGVPAATAPRSRSPVEMCGHLQVLAEPGGLRALARAGRAE